MRLDAALRQLLGDFHPRVWFTLKRHMWSLFGEVRLAWTHNQPDENGFLRQQTLAKLCSGPAFRFKQKDYNDRKHMIWFKTFIKEVKWWILEGICTSARRSDLNLLPISWTLDTIAKTFTFDEEVQKIWRWSHILGLLLQPLSFHWKRARVLQWMLWKIKIKWYKKQCRSVFLRDIFVCEVATEVHFRAVE